SFTHGHPVSVATASAPTEAHASTGRTTGSAADHSSVHPPSSLQAFDSTGIVQRPAAKPAATANAAGSGTTSTTAASTRCGKADGEEVRTPVPLPNPDRNAAHVH